MDISKPIGPRSDVLRSGHAPVLSPKTASLDSSAPIKFELPNAQVSISGQALLKQRLFGGDEPIHRTKPPGNMPWCMYSKPNDFLSRQDCHLLSKAYEFAQESGADLRFVDNLGSELADYRSNDNGRIMGRHNNGTAFDSEGHMVFYSFLDKDVATTKRILGSDALKSTQLDQGFIRYKTDVDCSATSLNQFEFLEQVINKFSAKGDSVPPLDARFSHYSYPEKRFNTRLSKEVYFTPKGTLRKGTAGTDALDPNNLTGKGKRGSKTKPTTPETVQDMFRRIMAKAFNSGWGIRVRSLAEFLMNSGR